MVASVEEKDEMLKDFTRVFDCMRVLPATINYPVASKRDLMKIIEHSAEIAHSAVREYSIKVLGVDPDSEALNAMNDNQQTEETDG